MVVVAVVAVSVAVRAEGSHRFGVNSRQCDQSWSLSRSEGRSWSFKAGSGSDGRCTPLLYWRGARLHVSCSVIARRNSSKHDRDEQLREVARGCSEAVGEGGRCTVADEANSWLFSWFKEVGLRNTDDVDRALRDPKQRAALTGIIEAASNNLSTPDVSGESSVVAGQSIDLSGWGASCMSENCLRMVADSLFARAWHFFDNVVVVGPSARHLQLFSTRESSDRFDYVIRSYYGLYRYLAEAGALKYLKFSEKRRASLKESTANYVTRNESARISKFRQEWIADMQERASFEYGYIRRSKGYYVAIEMPELEGRYGYFIEASRSADKRKVARNALKSAYEMFATSLLYDISYARMHGAPLGSVHAVHENLLTDQLSAPKPAGRDVAFNIPMPFIDGLPTKEILRIREQESASFEVFRSAIRKAIAERIKVAEDGERAFDIAIEIAEDVIGPALADIENRLNATLRSLVRGASVGLAVGGTVATVGLLTAFPVAGPIAGAALALPDIRNYLNARRDVETSEMYFLWKVSQKAIHAS